MKWTLSVSLCDEVADLETELCVKAAAWEGKLPCYLKGMLDFLLLLKCLGTERSCIECQLTEEVNCFELGCWSDSGTFPLRRIPPRKVLQLFILPAPACLPAYRLCCSACHPSYALCFTG